MGFVKGISRHEVLLFPEAIDEFVGEDNEVRFIDAWVDQLDIAKLSFERTIPKETGRPGYNPEDMLKLYIYGYLNRIRSSRSLEKETYRNCEVMWLLKKLQPDFKTISNFRKKNRKALKEVFREFSLLCKKLDLFGGEIVAIDGSKFRAANSSQKNFSRKKLEKLLQSMNEKIDKYLEELDTKDEEEFDMVRPSAKALREKLDYLKRHKEEYEQVLKKLEESGESQISLTDPDSRSMKSGKGNEVCYNVQSSVDDKHKLIIEHEVTNDVTDQYQLSSMAIKSKEILGVNKLEVASDMGYCNTEEFEKCLENDITPYVRRPITSANTSEGLYGKEIFRFDKENNCYICHGGEKLTYRFETVEKNRHIAYYVGTSCNKCSIKDKCTRNKGARRITRLINEHILEETDERAKENPHIMQKRKELCEHPFGTIKGWMRHGQFLTKGIENVYSEASLLFLSYNMKRVFNIVGVKKLIAALV